MYNNILVPLDGKPENEAALPHALGLAEKYGGTLFILSVAPHPVYPPARYSTVDAEPWLLFQRRKKEEAVEYLAGLARRPEFESVDHRRMVGEGPAHKIILKAIQEHQIDLVVMTKKRRSRLVRWILGSTPLHILRESPVPVLLVIA
jgi:nucleotide-binding universal stress UspA family protein